MPPRVLDVGQCVPDHTSIRQMLEQNFQAEVVRTHGPADTLEQLGGGQFDLVLINRKLDADYTDGMEILKQIKADEQLSGVPVMLVTNYEEHQQLAMQAGAERGFGKDSIHSADTRENLARFLR